MSEMVERVAVAIALTSYPYAKDSIARHGIAGFADIVEENFIEAARTAIEAMREVPDVCHDGYRRDKSWKKLNSKEVWNLWIDAALKP